MSVRTFRRGHTPEDRAAPLLPYIDPGFINHRLVETFIGPRAIAAVNIWIDQISSGTSAWQRDIQIDHIYTRVALEACQHIDALPLGVVACQAEPRLGQVVCSTELLQGSRRVFEKERIRVRWIPQFPAKRKVFFDLSTRHIRADTTKVQLSRKDLHSFIAHVTSVSKDELIMAPLIMGGPWLEVPPEGVPFETMFLHYDFFEHFVEDIDDFGKVRTISEEIDWRQMEKISEEAFKICLCEILGDVKRTDSGDETSDHFTTHLHLQGRRLTAAFLLKGPGSGFGEMQPRHLGRNGDQIVRLACEPAEMLIVQHCHDIGAAVRKTLRAFAVRPDHARRYCLIDGRDSFRLLSAYGMIHKALELSSSRRRERRV